MAEQSIQFPSAGIKGCTHIYAPAGQAGEYAPLACNPYRGCGHGCAYCYVPGVLKMKRAEFDAGAVPRDGFLAALTKDAKKYQAAGCREQVMLSFTTDPYHPGDTSLTRQTLEVLRDHGLGFCTLTKGGTRALADIDLFRPDRDAFACTLTSLDPEFSAKWERGAALPADRMNALLAFHTRGIFTWVSLEPTLDVQASLRIVEKTHSYVDLFKIGRVNYLPMTKTTDWRDYTLRMIELCQRLGVRHYVKKDLQPFLPAGYPNPLRVPQHHGTDGVTPTEASSKGGRIGQLAAACGVNPSPKLGWCEHCGEGVTDFCRGKTDACPKGLKQPGTRGVKEVPRG